ncbi:hypothetical protein A1L58_19875 [Shewanella baltica]|uniref:hypothetical protein n=1 Tax=Shewanella baltica TaxID=62322 RepID=UPI0007B48CE8|nr:hypothetical protein [Shewanella baltica]KZK67764.1 hypothetical protein A1L58_19875 [Shewanella baltica]
MENQSLAGRSGASAFGNFRVMNKLGTTFFLMFLIGTFLPLTDLAGWSNETISLYSLANPKLLIFLAVIGCIVNITGINRTAARLVSLSFIVIVAGWCFAQLYDIYDVAKKTAAFTGRNFDLNNLSISFEDITRMIPVRGRDLVSVASILLVTSFFGIFCCIFSPRYKEIQSINVTDKSIGKVKPSFNAEESQIHVNNALSKLKNILLLITVTVIGFIKYVYKVIYPLVDALLNKATDAICEKQESLKREHVKMVLLAMLVVLIYMIFF